MLAAVCYLPLLLTHPGKVGADTKTYLYLDPTRLLERAWSMWDPNVGLGTVTHQNIGYLWPMGPWFWLFQRLGTPDWIAQRLWLGSILFLSGLGVRYLMRTLGQHGVHVTAAMFVYAMSPYVLTLAARISALLLPFVGLPWMLALVIRATRTRGWLHPALFALLIPTVGSTNATALILAGVAPVLWFPFAIFVLGETTIVKALAVVGRIGLLTIGASLWWMAGLWAQGKYGLDVLQYSETAKTVADPATAPELLRGLGYWFFYGDDKLGPWIEPSVPYTQNYLLIAVTFLTACLGLLSAGFVRWRYRPYFASLIVVGLVIGVGAHPWDDPPLWGKGVKVFLLSDVGLALRSLPRAVPLIALGMSVLIGAGIASIAASARRMARPLTLAVVVLAIAGLPPLWRGNMVADNLQRPEAVPEYWTQAAQFLDGQGRGQEAWATRVLEVPGSDFASYRWGNTVDPITPGLMDRPFVARELIPYGTPVSADLLDALDRQLQEGLLDPAAVAPIARLMAVGDVTLRADLAYERFNLVRPRQVWDLLRKAPGLGSPTGFGGNAPNIPDPALPLEDEIELSSPPDLPDPPKVAVFPVTDPESILRTENANRPILVAGSGEGLVDAAGAGLLHGDELILYSGSLAGTPGRLRTEAARPEARLILTDTNRRSATRWGTVHETSGYTEEAGEKPLVTDLGDNRLPLFPDADDDSFTVTDQRGGVHARASSYGNPVTFTPENRAANAVDDDLRSGWSAGSFSRVEGQRLELSYDQPRTTDRINLTQFDQGIQNRWITKVRITLGDAKGGSRSIDADLGPSSRSTPGQSVSLGRSRTFDKVTIEVLADDVGRRDRYDDLSSVGFNDVRLGNDDLRIDEVVRLPVDLLTTIGRASGGDPLAVVLSRRRSRPTAALRTDEEPLMARAFSLPTRRRFALDGQARLSHRAPGSEIDRLIGVTSADGSALVATESRRLPGDMGARAVSAIDGDPSTHFSPGFLGQNGEYVDYQLAKPISFDHMDLRVVADGRHSVPTRLRIEADGKPAAEVDVPPIVDRTGKDASVEVPLDLPTVTGSRIRVVVESVREVKTNDWVSGSPAVMPVGISELGIPGLAAKVPGGRFDSGCRSDLLTIDGEPVTVRATGRVPAAVNGDPLDLSLCSTSRPVSLTAGEHLVRTGSREQIGIDVDRLTLKSAAATGRAFDLSSGENRAPTPSLRVLENDRDKANVVIGPRKQPTWLVLGQSHSLGWRATVDGTDLGAPIPVIGYANGWLVPAGADSVTIELAWTPQRVVWASIALSLFAVVVCAGLVGFGLRRRRRNRGPTGAEPMPGDQPAEFSLSVLWRSAGAPPSIRATVATTLVAGGATAAIVGPVAGVVVGAAALCALHWRRARILTVVGPATALAVSAGFTLLSQFRHDLPPGFGWPQYFEAVHQVAYAGVALLAVEVVVDRLWTGRWWPRSRADHATADSS